MVHIPHGALAIVEGVCSAQSCFLNWKFQSSNADCKTFRAALCLIELVKLESWLWQIFALSFWGDFPGGQHSFMNQEKGPVAIVYLENCFIGNALNSRGLDCFCPSPFIRWSNHFLDELQASALLTQSEQASVVPVVSFVLKFEAISG